MRRYVIGAFGVVAVGVLGYLAFFRNEESAAMEVSPVVRATVLHVVNVTGHAEPIERVQLGFAQGGRISLLQASEGDRVAVGELLGALEGGQAQALVAEAAAREARERALLEEVIAPARSVDVAVVQAGRTQARTAFAQAEQSARTALARAHTLADDAVREKLDELFPGAEHEDYSFGVQFESGTSLYTLTALREARVELYEGRAAAEVSLTTLRESARAEADLEATLSRAQGALESLTLFADRVALAVNRYIASDASTQAIYTSYRSRVAAARTALSSARADLVAAQTTLVTAKAAERAADRSVEQVLGAPKQATVATAEASLRAVRAAGETASALLRERHLYSPLHGVVGKVLRKKGELVGPYEPVLEIVNVSGFELLAYVPEADIARVKLGDRAKVTFDAFGNASVFEAEVVRIAESETYREGVPTYKTTLAFLTRPYDELVVRPGMTADIDIETARVADVLAVPSRSVLWRDGQSVVRVAVGRGYEERAVEVGLRGSEGLTELRKGVVLGEDIVLYVDE